MKSNKDLLLKHIIKLKEFSWLAQIGFPSRLCSDRRIFYIHFRWIKNLFCVPLLILFDRCAHFFRQSTSWHVSFGKAIVIAQKTQSLSLFHLLQVHQLSFSRYYCKIDFIFLLLKWKLFCLSHKIYFIYFHYFKSYKQYRLV